LAFPAFLDACVLYPQYLSDTLLTQGDAETFRPLWSADVLRELGGALIREAGLTQDAVSYRIEQMRAAFPDAEVTGYQTLIDGMTNQEKDRHVLAAAVRGNVEVLVTFNLRDFPESALKPFDIGVLHPDEFLLNQLDLYPGIIVGCLERQVAGYTHEPLTVRELLPRLKRCGVPRFAAEVRRHLLPGS
jgi:predicted nucleic acid-binding protein